MAPTVPPHVPRRADPALALALLAEASVLDTRDEAAFSRGHLAGAGRIGVNEFKTRRAELDRKSVV